MSHIRFSLLLLFLIAVVACSTENNPEEKANNKATIIESNYTAGLPLDKIQLPEGFKISVFADSVENARSMALSPSGTLFVGTRGKGSVYAIRDENGDMLADTMFVLAAGLKMPNGVAFRNGDLYVAEVSRILKFKDIENNLANPPQPEIIYADYPTETHHGWKFIAFGPDDKLYVPVGAPCNICNPDNPIFCSITRMNPDGSNLEIVQKGIRNTVGFTWHPENKELWFTDNGRDWLGDDIPACELNHAPRDNMHFGYPFCHQGDLPDEEFGHLAECSEFTAPVQKLGPHTAPLGVEFYTASQFPEEYVGQILLAEHGSWNRSKKIGYQVSLVSLDDNQKATAYKAFAKGWLDEQADEAWGRPVDIEFLPDGSMLVSDDYANVIYRIYYAG